MLGKCCECLVTSSTMGRLSYVLGAMTAWGHLEGHLKESELISNTKATMMK
jgi:hypothetical protein